MSTILHPREAQALAPVAPEERLNGEAAERHDALLRAFPISPAKLQETEPAPEPYRDLLRSCRRRWPRLGRFMIVDLWLWLLGLVALAYALHFLGVRP